MKILTALFVFSQLFGLLHLTKQIGGSECKCVLPLGYEKVRTEVFGNGSYTTVRGIYIRNALQDVEEIELRPLPIYVRRVALPKYTYKAIFDIVIFYSPADSVKYIRSVNTSYLSGKTGLPIFNVNMTRMQYIEGCDVEI